jgi:CRISPR-associated protein Csm3
MRLVKVLNIKKIMKVKTGLRIAGSDEEIRIGGIDNPIIRDPLTGYPYIPGSSLKGSLRSILEIASGKFDPYTNGPCSCGECSICKIFGKANKKETEELREHTRIIVRDAFLTENSKRILNELLPYGVEIKKENTIDRIKGTAKPRTFDRIPKGVEFEVNIVLKIFEGDNEKELLDVLKLAFKLVEFNYVGGSGSRGYGQVEFIDAGMTAFNVAEEINNVMGSK